MAKIFTAPAILTRVAYLRDGGLSLGFSTNELTAAEKVLVSEYHNQFGTVAFRQGDIAAEDIPASDASDEGKTPSQRLRGVLYVYWKQRGVSGDFEAYYRKWIEGEIEKVKAKLE